MRFVAGATIGVAEGNKLAADKSLWSSVEELAHLAAQKGAVLGAQAGAKVHMPNQMSNLPRST